ncbi:MAG TPA: hypothetical protein VMG12_43525 [Polyangiaceae bacterium]|nr:hypothetical protein [Polyangiaceae bacterium]
MGSTDEQPVDGAGGDEASGDEASGDGDDEAVEMSGDPAEVEVVLGTPAHLTASATDADLGGVAAGSGEVQAFEWRITNVGGTDTGALTLTPPDNAAFALESGCAALAPGASCTITVRFSPTNAGVFSDRVRLASSAEVLQLELSAKGQHRLTLSVTGRGQVTSVPLGLSCSGGQCTGLFDPGTVTLTARTTNGSGSFFSFWDANDCRASQSCRFVLNGSTNARVQFSELVNNLIFVSSEQFAPNLGGLAAYDAACNRLASAAGINEVSGDGYIAAMSDSTRGLRQRLGGARGWVRLDGFAVADTVVELFDGVSQQYNVAYDETGVRLGSDDTTLTGTLVDGNSAPHNCNDWTSFSSDVNVTFGVGNGGPNVGMALSNMVCEEANFPHRVLCMGVRRAAPLVDAPPFERSRAAGKSIWVSNTPFVPGSMTPDAKCQSERPAGVAQARAFIAYSDRAASAVLEPATNYFRPDGVLVGSGTEIANMALWAGPWVLADGSTLTSGLSDFVLTGARNPTSLPEAGGTCDDWTQPSMDGLAPHGSYGTGGIRFFNSFGRGFCSSAARLYCVEL